MSYDLMVFEANEAPEGHEAFIAWYRQQAEWAEGHSYNDPEVSTPKLRAWFLDMIKVFPAMNGPFAAPDDEMDFDDPAVTDYCIGKSVIYTAFAWSKAEDAYNTVFELAKNHGLGFFDTSGSESEVYSPRENGSWGLAHAAQVANHEARVTVSPVNPISPSTRSIFDKIKNLFRPKK